MIDTFFKEKTSEKEEQEKKKKLVKRSEKTHKYIKVT